MPALEVEVEDCFETEQPIAIEESFMSTIKPEVMEEGRIRLQGREGLAVISYEASVFDISVEELNIHDTREKAAAYRIGLKTKNKSVGHKLSFDIMYEIRNGRQMAIAD